MASCSMKGGTRASTSSTDLKPAISIAVCSSSSSSRWLKGGYRLRYPHHIAADKTSKLHTSGCSSTSLSPAMYISYSPAICSCA